MLLHLPRERSEESVTRGRLAIDGVFQCYTLEDVIRERPGVPVSEWKIKNETAIPAGRYRVVLTFSQRFQRVTPELLDVPGFTGIRIHPGNTAHDTSGCILVGTTRSGEQAIGGSRAAFNDLMDKLLSTGQEIWIEIENPAPLEAAA